MLSNVMFEKKTKYFCPLRLLFLIVLIFCIFLFRVFSNKIIDDELAVPLPAFIHPLSQWSQFTTNKSSHNANLEYRSINKLANCDSTEKNQISTTENDTLSIFYSCVRRSLKTDQTDWTNLTNHCQSIKQMKKLKFIEFYHENQRKEFLKPHCKDDFIVTAIGIQNDTLIEQEINKTIPNLKFYAVNSMTAALNRDDKEQFSALGKFKEELTFENFQTKSKMLGNDSMVVNFSYLVEKMLKIEVRKIFNIKKNNFFPFSKIDILFLNIDDDEFDVSTFFKEIPNGNKPTCQIMANIPIKPENEATEVFRRFVNEVLKDGNFIFWNPVLKENGIELLLINLKVKKCNKKFYS